MLSIDPRSATPPFEQLRVQLRDQVTSGELLAGSRLPTVRRLAADLGIAPNTVARTYRELEADGYIETRGRGGTIVSPQGDATERQGQAAAQAFAERIRQLGVSRSDALLWVERALS